ncbi:MAG: hypothetical protein KIS95_09290 [Anaerolineae bacterium]|uniref:hypothetical protein n=1 Tax=Promineifilum sp. TaxID=2664178 RepID=UPI001D5E6705|nr:hypothetical protein [Anaerolineales bacterium]MCB8935810.1 hypothetical protein [Promineifilum sp.]MCO5180433.1 hypothetical protein [Promineifilum sp.]MCW5847411.1 hypothetical protein [Anaerolineae bacterium]
MPTFKKILAGAAIVVAALGIVICLVSFWYSWSLNTQVTDDLVRLATVAERVLDVADTGLTRVDDGLTTVRGAVTVIEGMTRSAGNTLVETNLAFIVLERLVGDTLFPRIVAAQDTAVALTGTIVAFNDTLEAANRLPFVNVPTLSSELGAAAARLESARARVTEVQDTLRTIKEEKVGRPVAFITDRTTAVGQDLAAAQTIVSDTLSRIHVAQPRIVALRLRLPRLIDLLSVTITLVAAWLVAVQGFVLVRAYEYLRGRPINWARLSKREAEAA